MFANNRVTLYNISVIRKGMNDMKISVKNNGVWVVDNQDYYLTDAKDLVWNLFADKFLAYDGADAELQGIRSWNELKDFANRFGTMVVENED